MRKTGIIMHAVPGLSDEAYIGVIADLGFSCTFSGVFEKERHEKIAELLAKRGMQYETLHAPFNGINDIWLDSEEGEHMLSRLLLSIDSCVSAGAPIAVVHLSSGMTPPSITDIGRARFERLVSYARQKNVRIAFENQRMLANLAWALETFSEADGVDFCWDCGHESCFTPGREYMPLFGKRLKCTHIHDNHGVFDQDDHMLPFDGSINYERFADHIRNSGYKGSFMLEVFAGNSVSYTDMTPEAFLSRSAEAAGRLVALTDTPEQSYAL
ncbi:MAG: sugar phosphate isomerase/epimerase [Clostridia bacterium]|nr:sugar phosphate isomerase/epimerase [Clostridia bacterium]